MSDFASFSPHEKRFIELLQALGAIRNEMYRDLIEAEIVKHIGLGQEDK